MAMKKHRKVFTLFYHEAVFTRQILYLNINYKMPTRSKKTHMFFGNFLEKTMEKNNYPILAQCISASYKTIKYWDKL
jgi:hypothetical protein